MIEKDSIEWKLLLKRLNQSKFKTNRDSMCIYCWKIFSYQKTKEHRIQFPDHKNFIKKSKSFTSEDKIIQLAQHMNKLDCIEGKLYIENPLVNIKQ